MKTLSEHACFGGTQRFLAHASRECAAEMRFAVFEPPQAKLGRVPVLVSAASVNCAMITLTRSVSAGVTPPAIIASRVASHAPRRLASSAASSV